MSAREVATDPFPMCRLDAHGWETDFDARQQREAIDALESGGLVLFPRLAFHLSGDERRLLRPDCVKAGSKQVSFDAGTGELRNTALQSGPATALQQVLERYGRQSTALIRSLFPHYVPTLQTARTSFRPFEAAGRQSSWRKDDRRLHVDAFPSSPNQGRRLLRVFSNVNPDGKDRVWNIGEPFEAVATRFLPSIARRWPGYARLLHALGITRSQRTGYDQIMLQLHDRMKADASYQSRAVSARLDLPPGTTWIVMTDGVSHAALSGQFMFEQTFLLPVAGMLDPERSPLRILERLTGRTLA
jgi:hypothetical protein